MAEDRGPSYWDVSAYVDALRERDGVGVRWLLVPPIQRIDKRGWSSWAVSVEVWSLRTPKKREWHAQAAWGRGGSWATLPAALLATLRAYEQLREDERCALLAQTVF